MPAQDLRRFGAGPSLLASSVAVGATASGLVVSGIAIHSGSEAVALLAGACAPHLTRRSVPARGIHGIDEASSLPLMGSARRDGAVGQRGARVPAIRKVFRMARITKEGLEACMAFGMASLAVAEIGESVAGLLPDGLARELLAELEAAHHRLRDHFERSEDATVHTLAVSVLVLADKTGEAIREERDRPGR